MGKSYPPPQEGGGVQLVINPMVLVTHLLTKVNRSSYLHTVPSFGVTHLEVMEVPFCFLSPLLVDAYKQAQFSYWV